MYDMKKIMIIAALILAAPAVRAQSLTDALKNIATAAADKATGGALTAAALVGQWNYSGPGVKLVSDDTMAELGGAALTGTIEKKLSTAYDFAGIKPGACTFSFDKENNFTATIGRRTLSGTYEYEHETHVVTLHFTKGRFDLGTMNGRAYISGTDLDLVFPVDKLVKMVTTLGAKVSSLSTVTKMLEKYDSVMIGFEFSK